jgi:endonuclease YncB( thermonuclease family)
MPFLVIEGTYRLVGRTAAGNASGFEPDGDSMQFKPTNPALLGQLRRTGSAARLTSIGSTQLRFEGIDALELHFAGSHQPRPLADDARDFLTGKLAMNPVTYRAPDLTRVLPPVAHDATAGFILSRALEEHGRPVSFAFVGPPPAPDGTRIELDAALLRKSLNYAVLAAGDAYPLFYDTLFADLRAVLTKAAERARERGRGLWALDRSQLGLTVTDQAALEREAVVFPKLFRRLTEFLREQAGPLDQFLPWLAAKREQVLDLTTSGFTHFDDVVSVESGAVRLTRRPEQLVFVSAKTTSRAVAPWLAV